MHTPGAEEENLGTAARQVSEHASALARLEVELAQLELKRKLSALAVGIGLALAAAVFLLYALGFALAGAASGLRAVVPAWAALLIVAAALLLLAVGLGLVAARYLQRGAPPVPEQAIEEAKLTQEVLTPDGDRA